MSDTVVDQRTPLSPGQHTDLIMFMSSRCYRLDLSLLDRVCNKILTLEAEVRGLRNELSDIQDNRDRARDLAYEMIMRAIKPDYKPVTIQVENIIEAANGLCMEPEDLVANMVGKV